MLCDDPVRPHIPHGDRVGDNKDIFVLRDADGKAKAITCVSYQSEVPTNETELFVVNGEPEVAIFYTIWSYKKGFGRSLILDGISALQEKYPNLKRFFLKPTNMMMASEFLNAPKVWRNHKPVTKGPLFA